jgi:hypothetical protein
LEQLLEAKEKDASTKDLAIDKGKLKIAEFEGKFKKMEA